MSELEKRTWVYVQRPKEYEIAGCSCGNQNPDWSEFKGQRAFGWLMWRVFSAGRAGDPGAVDCERSRDAARSIRHLDLRAGVLLGLAGGGHRMSEHLDGRNGDLCDV